MMAEADTGRRRYLGGLPARTAPGGSRRTLKAKHGPGVKAKNVYFAGCTASYVEQDIGMASVRLLDAAGVDFTYLGEKENCCGTPMLVAGKWDVFAETDEKKYRGGQDMPGPIL